MSFFTKARHVMRTSRGLRGLTVVAISVNVFGTAGYFVVRDKSVRKCSK